MGIPSELHSIQESKVLLHIRIPRILLAMLVGGGLGVSGAALQGLFRNPLVEPGLIGVSSGGALFAVLFKDQLLGNLSGGEKQRVHLARVLAQIWENKSFPRYLLLDEPTSSMDIAQQHHILQLIAQLKHQNIGILTILHDLNLAANYADNVVLLKRGAILNQGPTREIMTPRNLRELFDYPIQVISEGPKKPIYISSLPAESNSLTYTYKLA